MNDFSTPTHLLSLFTVMMFWFPQRPLTIILSICRNFSMLPKPKD